MNDATHDRPDARRRTRRRVVAALLLVVAIAASYWILQDSGALAVLADRAALQAWVTGLGVLGPLAIVAMMVIAVVVSPIPSAPIALVAGAAYGHVWGTVYVLTGAEIGALVAFGVARIVGPATLHRWFGDRVTTGVLGSQKALMWIVLVSRLLPFISFDIVSYAAGLTVLSLWRFALATLAGIIPASFLLAHFGSEMATGEGDRILIAVLVLGTITLMPVLIKAVRRRR